MIAPLLVWRRGDDDFLLLTEPELGEVVRAQLTRMRFAAKCEIALEEHISTIVFGGGEGIPNRDYGRAGGRGARRRRSRRRCPTTSSSGCGSRPRTPRFGRELDDRVLPAEAGLEERAISFRRAAIPARSRSPASTTAAR